MVCDFQYQVQVYVWDCVFQILIDDFFGFVGDVKFLDLVCEVGVFICQGFVYCFLFVKKFQ